MIQQSRVMTIPAIMSVRHRAPAAAAAIPWWLTGGISAANCLAAYAPKGAASSADAKINLNSPGTNNATGGIDPAWDTAIGWTSDGTKYLNAGTITSSSATMSLIFRYSGWAASGDYRCGGGIYIAPLWFSATNNTHYAGSFQSYSAGGATSGVVATAAQKHYFNGAYKNASTGAIADLQFSILSRANGSQTCNGSISHYAIYDIDISPYIAALSAAIAAL